MSAASKLYCEISLILSPIKPQYSVVKADLKIGMRCEHEHRRLC